MNLIKGNVAASWDFFIVTCGEISVHTDKSLLLHAMRGNRDLRPFTTSFNRSKLDLEICTLSYFNCWNVKGVLNEFWPVEGKNTEELSSNRASIFVVLSFVIFDSLPTFKRLAVTQHEPDRADATEVRAEGEGSWRTAESATFGWDCNGQWLMALIPVVFG